MSLDNDLNLTRKFLLFKKHFKIKNIYIYLFLERGEGKEKEGEKHQCVVASHTSCTGDLAHTQACALTGNQTGNCLVCRPAFNPLSHTSQHKILAFLS